MKPKSKTKAPNKHLSKIVIFTKRFNTITSKKFMAAVFDIADYFFPVIFKF